MAILLVNKKHKLKLWINITAPIAVILTSTMIMMLIYFSIYYHATKDVDDYLKTDEVVEAKETNSYYLFDNISQEEKAIIFYGGAKVEEKSYAPMLNQLAHKGIDVVLLKMPFRFAIFDISKADSFYKSHFSYSEVYLMGHSLGGVCASICLSKTSLDYKGIIFLASYSDKPLDDKYKALSIYGSEDHVLNMDAYNKSVSNFPNGYETKIIEGGNHSGFAYYGNQNGDGKASISKEEQINLTVNYISSFTN